MDDTGHEAVVAVAVANAKHAATPGVQTAVVQHRSRVVLARAHAHNTLVGQGWHQNGLLAHEAVA